MAAAGVISAQSLPPKKSADGYSFDGDPLSVRIGAPGVASSTVSSGGGEPLLSLKERWLDMFSLNEHMIVEETKFYDSKLMLDPFDPSEARSVFSARDALSLDWRWERFWMANARIESTDEVSKERILGPISSGTGSEAAFNLLGIGKTSLDPAISFWKVGSTWREARAADGWTGEESTALFTHWERLLRPNLRLGIRTDFQQRTVRNAITPGGQEQQLMGVQVGPRLKLNENFSAALDWSYSTEPFVVQTSNPDQQAVTFSVKGMF